MTNVLITLLKQQLYLIVDDVNQKTGNILDFVKSNGHLIQDLLQRDYVRSNNCSSFGHYINFQSSNPEQYKVFSAKFKLTDAEYSDLTQIILTHVQDRTGGPSTLATKVDHVADIICDLFFNLS